MYEPLVTTHGPLSWEQFIHARMYGDLAPWLQMRKDYPFYAQRWDDMADEVRRRMDVEHENERRNGRPFYGMFGDQVFGR